jgi:hypothetical protein
MALTIAPRVRSNPGVCCAHCLLGRKRRQWYHGGCMCVGAARSCHTGISVACRSRRRCALRARPGRTLWARCARVAAFVRSTARARIVGGTCRRAVAPHPQRTRRPPESPRWGQLGQFLAEGATNVIVDAGSAPPPPQLAAAAQHRLLVIRPCYLALRRAAASAVNPTGVIVVHEPGRALRAQDVAYAVQAPVVAELTTDPAVARAVDAGLLASRLPRTLAVALRELVP